MKSRSVGLSIVDCTNVEFSSVELGVVQCRAGGSLPPAIFGITNLYFSLHYCVVTYSVVDCCGVNSAALHSRAEVPLPAGLPLVIIKIIELIRYPRSVLVKSTPVK